MANSVEEYWEVDGVSLSTYAWTVQSLSGREGIPARRGENQIVAYRPGEIWRPKTPTARSLSLAMWAKGWTAADTRPTNLKSTFRTNLESLKSLFGVYDRQLALTKRIRTESGLAVLTGLGECVSTLDPAMQGDAAAALVVDLMMADPFWYGAQVAPTVPRAGATITNPGTAKAEWLTIGITGPLSNPVVLTNQTLNIVLTYAAALAVGETLTIDTGLGTAISSVSGSKSGLIQHSGAATLMALKPGANVMLLTTSTGTGQATITYKPPYL